MDPSLRVLKISGSAEGVFSDYSLSIFRFKNDGKELGNVVVCFSGFLQRSTSGGEKKRKTWAIICVKRVEEMGKEEDK